MVQRHDHVFLAVDEEHRDRRERLDRGGGRIIVLDRHGREPLEGPGEHEARELFARDAPVIREWAVEHHGAHAGAVLRMRDVMHRESRAKALPEDDDAVRIDVGPRKQRAHRGIDVELYPGERGGAFRAAVATIVEREHAEALRRQPRHVGKLRADVLAVAVQIEHRGAGLAARRQEPGEELSPVRGADLYRLVLEAELAGRLVKRGARLKKGRAAARKAERKRGGDEAAHQK
jgi:hypothetical protein